MATVTWIITGLVCGHLWSLGDGQFSDNTPPSMWLERTWEVQDLEPLNSIITRVRANDDENDRLEFGLEKLTGGYNQDNSRPLPFRIDNETGVVYLNDTLKGRAGENFLLYVTVFDGKLTAKSEVYVNIVNKSSTAASSGGKRPNFLPTLSNGPGVRPRPPGFFIPSSPPGFSRKPRPTQPPRATPKTTPSVTEPPAELTTTPPEPGPNMARDETKSADSGPKPPEDLPKPPDQQPKSNVTHGGLPDGAVATMSDLAITIVPIVGVCGLFVVGGLMAWMFRKKLCRKGKKAKDDMGKEPSGGITLEEPIAMQQWRGPRAHSNRYEPWETEGQQNSGAPPPLKPNGDRWEFPRHRLKVFNILGEGCFGQVWRCEAMDIDGVEGTSVVAVKTLKENASEKERTDLVQELQVMKMLEPHPNVVRLLGCCTEKEPLFVIMEFVAHGKLQSFLRNSRAERYYGNLHGPSKTLTSRDLTSFVYQVARGMEFLSGKGIIHRDLAARNILVGEGNICKVADFGFARDVISSHVYERKSEGRLPIRWMAPESLYDNIFSVKSDVWSFGILIWEIVTLGSTPYPGLAACDVMKKVRDGYRLDKPEHCRRELYNIMYYCWDKDSKERPSFPELVTLLEQLLLTETDYIELERFPDHSYYNMVSLSGEKL